MKKSNLNNAGSNMPHGVPKEDFLESFSRDLYARIEDENITPVPLECLNVVRSPGRSVGLVTRFSLLGGVAASLAIALVLLFDGDQVKDEARDSDNLVENMDSYLSGLSDDEFERLLSMSTTQYDFYMNLPNY